MIGGRARVLAFIFVAVIAAVLIAVALWRREPSPPGPRPAAERPPLLLLTSLPLMFSEDFSLKGGSPVLRRLETRYQVLPISVTDPGELSKGRLLLIAQPLAQPAEDLVALDNWVRGGGRVLLLADPMLEWPSKRPLGDMLRPPPMFMDTGLLAHWGLRLDAPAQRGPAIRKLGGYEVMTISPGRLTGKCSISGDALVADCRIGTGEATIVADADFLDTDGLGPGSAHNIDGLLQGLANLERARFG